MFLLIGFIEIHAQQSFSSTGGDVLGNDGSVSYSVGQLVNSTNIGTNNTTSEGIQQAYEISVIAGINQAEGINLKWSAYPNPTSNSVQLSVGKHLTINNASLNYQLVSSDGKLLESNKVISELTTINLSTLVSSTYFIRIFQEDKELKTFIIIKSN
ncbi:MAG: T9SS type A sorting domain-containing protein [Paludibacter sp.]